MTTKGIALVTGAGSGIGRAVARRLLKDGWNVALAGRRESTLVETASGFESTALIVQTDVSREGDVEACFSAIVAKWSRLDLLFNNAGIFPPGQLIDELSVDSWRESVEMRAPCRPMAPAWLSPEWMLQTSPMRWPIWRDYRSQPMFSL